MDVEVRTSLSIGGRNVTSRQLEALAAVGRCGSMTAAAKELGISVPVVHKYMGAVERAAGAPVLKSTPLGSELTPEGARIVEIAGQMELRCRTDRPFTVSCTPVTEDLVWAAVSQSKVAADVVISDDAVNLRALKEGLTDMIVIDDPAYLFDAEEFTWAEVGQMDMVHADNGPSYIRYRYGAQRIAFQYLDLEGVAYSVDAETPIFDEVLSSGKSFIVDELLLMRRGVKIKSATDKRLLRHTINAVYRRETEPISRILRALPRGRSP